jgi:hypothetical protein
MDTQQAAARAWPPRVGDYARVRTTGILGEVVSVTRRGSDCRYTLNLFEPAVDEPLVYRLDDLEPVWDGPSMSDAGQSWPSWTR